MHYIATPGPTLPNRFAYLIGGLCFYLGSVFSRDRSTAPLTLLVAARLRRLSKRFALLVARVEAGIVLPVRVRVTPRAARVASPPLMPRDFGWLSRLMPEGRLYAELLEQQGRSDAELAALLTKAPQAGRFIRPVLWMMGREVPENLRLPARVRAPRKVPEPVVVDDVPYRRQPTKSHYPTSIWPTEAQSKRAGKRLALAARLQKSPD